MRQLQLSQADVLKLAQLVNKGSTLLARHWNLRIPDVQRFLDRFCHFVRELNTQVGARSVAFEVQTVGLDPTNSVPATVQLISDQLEVGQELLLLDLDMSLQVHSESLLADRVDLCNYSEENQNVIFLVEGSGFIVIIKGVQKQYINVYAPGAREPRLTKYSHSCREYGLLIAEHHELQLRNEMEEFWADRTTRVLVGGRKTEWVFQKSLWRWLLINVSDGRVVGEVQKLSPERTDIEIQGLRGTGTYILEIKWLGKNRSGSSYRYDERQIKAGVEQVKSYLTRDQLVTKAVLVCYDGRDKADHDARKHIDPTDWVPRSDYYVLYLPSDSPSDHGGN